MMNNNSLNIQIRVYQEPVKKVFILPREMADLFDQYVALAQKEYPGVSEAEIAAAMFMSHMKRDQFFQRELKRVAGAAVKRKVLPVLEKEERGHG